MGREEDVNLKENAKHGRKRQRGGKVARERKRRVQNMDRMMMATHYSNNKCNK